MYICSWVLLFFTYKTFADQSESKIANNVDIYQVDVKTENVRRIKYRDGEVLIIQNRQKDTDFFFTPFPHLHLRKRDVMKM